MDKKNANESFPLIIIAWIISLALTALCFYYQITISPTINIFGTNGLFVIIWFPSLIILGKYIYTWVSRKKTLAPLLLLIATSGACLYQLSEIFTAQDSIACYSISQEELKVSYECVCKNKYLESPYEYVYDDCQFSGLSFLPLAQKLPLPNKRYGSITIGVDSQADFTKYDWLGKPFGIEHPSQLIIVKSGYIQIGYVNFNFSKKTDIFDVSLIADVECSKYYANPISIKNGESVSVKICNREYTFKFMNRGDFVITLLN